MTNHPLCLRIKHSIHLYESGLIKNIIFTGGKGEGQEFSESLVAMEYAMENGVPRENIMIEEISKITEENILYAMEIAEKENFENLIIVSDPLHMKRAIDMSDDYGIEVHSSPTPTSKIDSFSNKFKFLVREVFFYIAYKIVEIISF